MSEKLVNGIIGAFGGVTALAFGQELLVFIISLLPILELRGGLLAATLLKMDFVPAYLISIVGNTLPIPLVLLFLDKVFNFLKKSKKLNKLISKLEKKILSKKGQIEKYGYLGLLLFVGIPLPGTGAWTGAGLAVLLNLNKKKAFISIMLGVILASIIMSILSYGILDKIIH